MHDTETLQPSLAQGTLIAERYRLIKAIGCGGMGEVYLAEDTLLEGEQVALKLLHREFSRDERQSKRFLREVQLTRKVTHPNVVRTFDVGTHNGQLYLTMEYVRGETLKSLIVAGGLDEGRILLLISEIGKGLEAIHQADIVHRDLKPSNIVVRPDGTATIMDFGIARPGVSDLTGHNEVIGSAPYMAPELWVGREVSTSADLYALGVIWYELVTGILPFDGQSPAEVMCKHLEAVPVRPSELVEHITPWVENVLLSLLAKSPLHRPASARAVLETIQFHNTQAGPVMAMAATPPTLPPAIIAEPAYEGVLRGEDLEQPHTIGRSLEELPSALDVETANSWQRGRARTTGESAPLFGRPVEHFTFDRLGGLTVRAALLCLVALSIIAGLKLSVGAVLREHLLVVSGATAWPVLLLLIAGAIFLYAVLLATPLIVVRGLLYSPAETARSFARMMVCAVVLVSSLLLWNVVRLTALVEGKAKIERSTIMSAFQATAINSAEAALLIPYGSTFDVSSKVGMNTLVSASPKGWLDYLPFGLYLLSYLVFVVACAKDIPLKAAVLFRSPFLSLIVLIGAICAVVGVLSRILLSLFATSAAGTFSAFTVTLGPVTLELEKLGLGVAMMNWGIVLVALTTVTIRRRNAGLE